MNTYIVECESGVMAFQVKATCLSTLFRTLNLKNVYRISDPGGMTLWVHPSTLSYEF